jgi:hypothetical protein
MFFDRIERIGCSAPLGHPNGLDGLGGLAASTIILGFSGLPVEPGQLPGVTLCPLLRSRRSFTHDSASFSRARGGVALPTWDFDEVRSSQAFGYSFVTRLSAAPVFSRITSRPGVTSAVASLVPDEEPLQDPPPNAFRNWFPILLSYSLVYQQVTDPEKSNFKVWIPFVSFEAVDL